VCLKQVTIRALHLPLSDYPSVDAPLLQANGMKLNRTGHSCVRDEAVEDCCGANGCRRRAAGDELLLVRIRGVRRCR
jgi:hypothetical protein